LKPFGIKIEQKESRTKLIFQTVPFPNSGTGATKDAQTKSLRFHKNKKKAPERELFSLLYFF
jgi:hypothetical protein